MLEASASPSVAARMLTPSEQLQVKWAHAAKTAQLLVQAARLLRVGRVYGADPNTCALATNQTSLGGVTWLRSPGASRRKGLKAK